MSVSFNQLITDIYKDKRYLSICNKITNGSHLAQDLWHKTIEALYDSKAKVLEMKERGTLEVYIVGVINNIWGKRGRVSKYSGNTHDLYMYCDNHDSWSEYKEYVKGLTGNERQVIKAAVTELNKKLKSKEESEAQNAQLVWDVCKSNVWQVSKANGVNHMKVKRTFVKTINQIKRKLDE